MIKVYFETNSTAELVAIFNDDDTYMKCLPGLKRLQKEGRWLYITKSVVETSLNELVEVYDNILNHK